MEPCVRCGMCCIIAPCGAVEDNGELDENSDCPFLVVHDNLTTSCTNELALEVFVKNGNGCIFQDEIMLKVYNLHKEMYCLVERKKQILARQKSSCCVEPFTGFFGE